MDPFTFDSWCHYGDDVQGGERGQLLDVVVDEGGAFLELLAHKYEVLLVQRHHLLSGPFSTCVNLLALNLPNCDVLGVFLYVLYKGWGGRNGSYKTHYPPHIRPSLKNWTRDQPQDPFSPPKPCPYEAGTGITQIHYHHYMKHVVTQVPFWLIKLLKHD